MATVHPNLEDRPSFVDSMALRVVIIWQVDINSP